MRLNKKSLLLGMIVLLLSCIVGSSAKNSSFLENVQASMVQEKDSDQSQDQPEIGVSALGYCVMNADTGEIVLQKNADEKLHPASITKIMTLLVTVEQCKNLDSVTTVSENALNQIAPLSSTLHPMPKPGEQFTIRDLLYGLTMCSGNECANILAEAVCGDIDSFVELMNEKIDSLQKQLGELQDQLADYNNLKAQNDLYKDALGLKEEHKDFEFAEASVIGRDSANPYCSFTVSKGTLNGIKDGAAVLYGKYLIGVIKKAYPTYSVVTTILDPDFSVSAYDISTNELSFVSGDAELAQKGICKFENLSSSSKISYGSIIATAGISKKMPKGIIIGTVKDISNEEKDISSYASIEPGTDIEKLTSVLILTNYSESEGK